jgi:hypothetical protein
VALGKARRDGIEDPADDLMVGLIRARLAGAWRFSRLASVMTWSASPRMALALASVVSMRSWRNRPTSRFRNIAHRCWVSRPSL